MAEERFEETEEGYYVQHGDVREWVWKGKAAPKAAPVTTTTAEAVVKPKKAAKK